MVKFAEIFNLITAYVIKARFKFFYNNLVYSALVSANFNKFEIASNIHLIYIFVTFKLETFPFILYNKKTREKMIKLLLNKEIDRDISSEAYHEEEDKLNSKRVSKKYTLLSYTSFPNNNDFDPYDFSMLASREVERLKILSIESYYDLRKYNFSEFQITAVTNGISNILKNIVFFQRANLFFREIWTEPLDFYYLLPEEAIKLNKNGYYYIYDLREIDYLDALKLSYFNSEIFSKLVYLAKIAFKKDISHNTQYVLNGIVIKDAFHNKCYENVRIENTGLPYFVIEGLHKEKIFKLFDLMNIDFSVYMELRNICDNDGETIMDCLITYLNNKDNEFDLEAFNPHSLKQSKEITGAGKNKENLTYENLHKNNNNEDVNNSGSLIGVSNISVKIPVENVEVGTDAIYVKTQIKNDISFNDSFLAKNDVDPYDVFSMLGVEEAKQLKQLSIFNYYDLERFNYLEFKTLLVNNGLSKLLLNTKFIRYANLFLKSIDDEPLDVCYFTHKNTKILNNSGYFILKDLKNINYINALALSNLDFRLFTSLIAAVRVAFQKDIAHNNQFVIEANLVKDIINNKIYENKNIENIGMSYVCSDLLKRNGVKYLFDLLNADYSLFFGSNGLGKNKFSEIMESLLKYLNDKRNELDLETAILNFLKQKEEGVSLETINAEINNGDAALIIENLTKTNKIKIINGKYFYRYEYSELQSFEDYLNTLKDSIEKKMVLKKYAGETLEVIGSEFGITRERARQIIQKFIGRNLSNSSVSLVFKEDKYKYLYQNYAILKSDFINIFHDIKAYSYLSMRYNHGKKDLDEISDDQFVDSNLKKLCLKYSFRNYILLDGEYVLKKKGYLLKHFLKVEKKEFKQHDLINIFNDYLAKILPYEFEKFIIDMQFLRSVASRNDPEIISKYPSILRYYNFYSYDYSELLETLDLKPYNNMEISAKILFDNYKFLMDKYNISDFCGLHCILKRICSNGFIGGCKVSFGRNPMLQIGKINRKEYILNKWKENNYSSYAEFAREISAETGVAANVVLVDWIGFNVDDIKRIQFSGLKVLTNEERAYLESKLVKDYYFIDEVSEFANSYSAELGDKINKNNIESLGYNWYSGMIIKKPVNMSGFLLQKFMEKDIFNKSEFNKYSFSSLFYEVFYDLANKLQIIEYTKSNFINIRKLKQYGYDENKLHNLQLQVFELADKYDYFTIYRLKKDGHIFEIDELGFENFFIESIVKTFKHLNYTSFENTIIFSKSNFTSGDFIRDIILKFKKISFSDLLDYLLNEYGISAVIYKIKFVLTDTDIYYDNTMETFYDSYKTYIEDL